MKKEQDKKSGMPIGLAIFIVVIITFFVAVVAIIAYDVWTTETIVVEGTIISAEYIGEENAAFFNYDVIRVVFDNNESYDLVLGEGDHDFTVHSKMILKLKSYGSDKWSVVKIIKVPNLVEGR